jgi:hypothetical protein
MRIQGLRLAVCGAMVGATLSLASPANAGGLSNVDPATDVRYYDLAQGIEAAIPGTRMPAHHNGDLRRFSVRYGEKRIRVALNFRELTRTEPVLMVQGRFRFPGSGQLNYAEAVVTATEANRSGTARMTTADCGVQHRISYAKNRVRLSFPVRCFSSPRWLQFNAWVLTMDHKRDPTYLYGDHIFPVLSSDENAVERFTRRIRRP